MEGAWASKTVRMRLVGVPGIVMMKSCWLKLVRIAVESPVWESDTVIDSRKAARERNGFMELDPGGNRRVPDNGVVSVAEPAHV